MTQNGPFGKRINQFSRQKRSNLLLFRQDFEQEWKTPIVQWVNVKKYRNHQLWLSWREKPTRKYVYGTKLNKLYMLGYFDKSEN